MRFRLPLLAMLCLLAGASALEAGKWDEAGQFFLQTYTPKQYGASPQNWAVAQDARGMLYVGNTDGLIEYDGVRWRRVALGNEGAVRSLGRDAGGRLYVGGQGDFGYLAEGDAGATKFVSLASKLAGDDKKFSNVWSIVPLAEGVYFSASERLFLVRPNGEVKSWPTETRFRRAFAVNGQLHVAMQGKGLFRMEGAELKMAPGGEELAAAEIRGAVQNREWVIYVGSRSLYRAKGERVEAIPLAEGVLSKDNTIYSVLALTDEVMALGTTNGGLLLLDGEGHLLRRLGKSEGLPSNYVASLGREPGGALWIGTDSGLARWDVRLSSFDQLSGLSGSVLALAEWRERLYVGTSNGLNRMVSGAGKPGQRFEAVPGMSERVFVLLAQEQGLWVGGENGLYQVKGEKAELVMATEVVYDLSVSKATPGDLLAVGRFGAMRLRETRGKWEKVAVIPAGGQEFRTILEDEDGSVWISTLNGVVHGRLEEGAKPETISENDGLPKGWKSFFRIAGRIVLATEKGLLKYSARDRKFVGATEFGAEWAAERNVLLAKEMLGGGVWLSGPGYHGVLRPGAGGKNDKGDWDALPLFRAGLDEVWTVLEETDGTLWAAGPSGVLIRRQALERKVMPDFAVYLRRIEQPETHKVVYSGLGKLPALRFPYRGGSVRFEFSAPFFDEPTAVEYQVRLEGDGAEWSNWSGESFREYGNLWEGEYRFRVRARNPYGQMSEEVSAAFVVEAPWYRRWWAYALYVALSTGLVWGVFKWRLKQLRDSNQRLEEIVEERTTEIRRQRDQIQEEEKKTEGLLLNILPGPVAAELRATGSVKPMAFDDVTVCFTDFVGFTISSEKLEARDVVAHLDEYFTAFDQIMGRYGLEKLKTIGDAYMFAAGLPEASRSHAVDAVLAALEVLEKAKEISLKQEGVHWRLRVGLHAGPVVAGVVGLKKFAFDIWGDTVNMASRMESSGMPNRVNVSERMYFAIRDFVECEARGNVMTKDGRELPMYFVVGMTREPLGDWVARYEQSFGHKPKSYPLA